MSENTAEQVRALLGVVYRAESRRVFATLVRLLGDFDLAEEALHDAFTSALEQWQREGVPANPRAWLVSAGRFKAIDALRRRARFDDALAELAERLAANTREAAGPEDEGIEDDRRRPIFTCCHPAPPPEARVAPPGACGAGRPVPATGQNDGSPGFLSTGPSLHAAGAGAAVPRAAARGTARLKALPCLAMRGLRRREK